jgi:predicted AAA+ superfamily ATPase
MQNWLYMQRTAYQKLKNWQLKKDRKPLIVQGARQVGKTFLIKDFGQKEFKNLLYLNFEEDPGLKALFKGALSAEVIIRNIEIHKNIKIKSSDTLIFFDEVQICDEALTSLKYFYEQIPEQALIAAGSLLGLKIKKKESSSAFPVGKVEFLNLHPLTFFEFLNAQGKIPLLESLSGIASIENLPEFQHEQALQELSYYFCVGGMPEVVNEFIKTGNLQDVRQKQNDLLRAYLIDFAKYAGEVQTNKITAVWDVIAGQLAKQNKKFKYSSIGKNARARDYEEAVQWLHNAGLLIKITNISTAQLPLKAYEEQEHFKLYFFDVGLLGARLQLPMNSVLKKEELYWQFSGALAENYVCQELISQDLGLHYWQDGSRYELDLVFQVENQIVPLEVKAGKSTQNTSLRVFTEKFKITPVFRTNQKNLIKSGDITNIPLYLVSRLNGFLQAPHQLHKFL